MIKAKQVVSTRCQVGSQSYIVLCWLFVGQNIFVIFQTVSFQDSFSTCAPSLQISLKLQWTERYRYGVDSDWRVNICSLDWDISQLCVTLKPVNDHTNSGRVLPPESLFTEMHIIRAWSWSEPVFWGFESKILYSDCCRRKQSGEIT